MCRGHPKTFKFKHLPFNMNYSNIITFSLVSVLTQLHNTFTQNNGVEMPLINIQKLKKHEQTNLGETIN